VDQGRNTALSRFLVASGGAILPSRWPDQPAIWGMSVNVNPPVFYPGPSNNAWQTIPAPLFNYDIEGRVYRVGVRFKY